MPEVLFVQYVVVVVKSTDAFVLAEPCLVLDEDSQGRLSLDGIFEFGLHCSAEELCVEQDEFLSLHL